MREANNIDIFLLTVNGGGLIAGTMRKGSHVLNSKGRIISQNLH